MMKNLLSLTLVLLSIAGFSQSTSDYYSWLVQGKIKKEQLAEAKLMFDVIPNFPKAYYGNLMDYVSVEISGICEGKKVSAVGSNEVLTLEQKTILNSSDLGTDIKINIKFSYKDPANDAYGGGGRIKEIGPVVVMVVPEIETQFPGGSIQMSQYLKENVMKQTSDTLAAKKILNAVMDFIVDEEGKIIGAKISRSSLDPKIDELLLKAANKMPKWSPAQNSKGIKVKQYVSIPVRRGGC